METSFKFSPENRLRIVLGSGEFWQPGSCPRVWGHDGYETNTLCCVPFISTGVKTCVPPNDKSNGSPVHLHGCGDMLTLHE